MILGFFSFLVIAGALLSAFSSNIKRSILSLWVCNLGMGGLFLGLGMEFLAVTQWIVGTLVAVTFIFFSVMFGEFEQQQTPTLGESRIPQSIIEKSLPFGLGAVFCGIFALALSRVNGAAEKIDEVLRGGAVYGVDLTTFGKVFVREHFLSLQILALMLLLVIVGGGVIARPEAPKSNKEGI